MLSSFVNKIVNNLILTCILLLSSCGDNRPIISSDAFSYECIWNQSPHCAFTDLIEYNGKVYCCFREGIAHLPYNLDSFGRIRILESIDGIHWESIGTISDPDYDLRDPKLSITPDSRLMLIYGRYVLEYENCTHPWTMVKFFDNEELNERKINNKNIVEVSIENDIHLSNYWLWRIKWIDGIAYGVAYKNGKFPLLVKSDDGVKYSVITELKALGNEADVEPMPNGSMLMVMRAQLGNGFIGLAYPPFTDWEWHETSTIIHCPAIVSVDSEVYVAGRSNGGTMLFRYKDYDIKPFVLLPSQGYDNAYPGIIYRNGLFWVSFYDESPYGHSIFLVKF